MTAAEFVAALDERNQAVLRRLEPDATLTPEVTGDLTVTNLLKVALRNEIEATEIAARWLVVTDDVVGPLLQGRMLGSLVIHVASDTKGGAEQKNEECFHGRVGAWLQTRKIPTKFKKTSADRAPGVVVMVRFVVRPAPV